MDDFFNSKKYIILLIAVCLLFTIITIKVFDYMPKPVNNLEYEGYYPNLNKGGNSMIDNKQAENSFVINNTDDESDDDEDEEDDNNDEEENSVNDSSQRTGHIDYMPPSAYQNLKDFDEIPAPKGSDEDNIQAYNKTSFSDNN